MMLAENRDGLSPVIIKKYRYITIYLNGTLHIKYCQKYWLWLRVFKNVTPFVPGKYFAKLDRNSVNVLTICGGVGCRFDYMQILFEK